MIVYVIVEEEFDEADFGGCEMVHSEVLGVYYDEDKVRDILAFSDKYITGYEFLNGDKVYPYKRAYYQKVEVQ